jgi:hypothetical protein
MTGLVGWFFVVSSIVIFGLFLIGFFFFKAGERFEQDKEPVYISTISRIFPLSLLIFGYLFLIGILIITAGLKRGFLAEDHFLSRPLKNYGIYETLAYKWIGPDCYVVILKDQVGTILAYRFKTVPPKVFKVVPVKKDHQRREYQVYQPSFDSVKSSTNATRQETGIIFLKKQEEKTEKFKESFEKSNELPKISEKIREEWEESPEEMEEIK